MAEVQMENNTIYILDVVAKPLTLLVRWLAVGATCCLCHHAAIMIFTRLFPSTEEALQTFFLPLFIYTARRPMVILQFFPVCVTKK
jgi:hypothetical protein